MMNLLAMNGRLTGKCNCFWKTSTFTGGKSAGLRTQYKSLPANLRRDYEFCTFAFAKKMSAKRSRRKRESQNDVTPEATAKRMVDENEVLLEGSPLEDDNVDILQKSASVPSRSVVLKACTITSGLIAVLGVVIRQVSHVASVEGLPILDCSTEVSFGVEIWHLELIVGLVILISSCRYLLLKIWPDFAESTEEANRQVLTSLQPFDYLVVSVLPGISEELLFRGALQPLFGMDWKSVLAVAILFGVLHLGNGRKYSFAVWATFVGSAYGYATISSSSIIVPMASHALNNLAGGILWRYTSKIGLDSR